MRAIARLLILAVALSGCAEYVRIKSYPGGAKAYVDGVSIGTTPATTAIPRSQVGAPHTWRVEFRNCDAAEGNLETGIAGGRIVGYIFTAGILAIFRGPHYYRPVDAILTGGDCEVTGQGRPAPAPQPGIMIQNIVGDQNQPINTNGPAISKTQRLAERLTTLRDLYNRKLISQQVYEQESQKAVQEFGDWPPEPAAIEEKIAKRAYERYIARGGADGRDLDDWLTAERELQDEAEERPD